MFSSIMLSKINDKVFVNQFLMMVLTADMMDLLGEQRFIGEVIIWINIYSSFVDVFSDQCLSSNNLF